MVLESIEHYSWLAKLWHSRTPVVGFSTRRMVCQPISHSLLYTSMLTLILPFRIVFRTRKYIGYSIGGYLGYHNLNRKHMVKWLLSKSKKNTVTATSRDSILVN